MKVKSIVAREVVAPFCRADGNYDMDHASFVSGLRCDDASRAIQSAQEECDINTIVKRFGLTGQLPSNLRAPVFGDFTEVMDFHTAMEAVRKAQEAFDQMPANVRSRFHNDPQEFVAFCSDDGNRVEAEKLGLVLPKVPEPPVVPISVRVVGDAPPPPKGGKGGEVTR